MSELPLVRLTGGPAERGHTHGEAFAEAIRQNFSTYMERFEYNGVPESEVRDQAAEFLSRMADWNPAYAAELRGVAAGSGVDETDVAALNARYEVLYAAYSEQSAGTDGCTSFALLPEATSDGHVYVGQNWDWIPAVADALVVIEVHPDEGPSHLGITEAGIVGAKMGVNEHGIGLAVNGLVTPDDGESPFQKPFHVRCREVLSAERYDKALEPLVATPHACSANFIVGHRDGEAIDIEAAPDKIGYLHPDDGVLTHSNHFRNDGFHSRMERQLPDSLYRACRLHRLLDDPPEGATAEDIAAALGDHFGRPASICRHIDEDAHRHERTQTDVSVVADLTEHSLRVARGPPCESSYLTYQLD
ncbi:MAG: C45 family peptidase [Natronomonas sp.]|uniref:C45 family peptidase n=1 Tax=Natronomonas sp. TaxID=2184060 RepID=UPI00287028AB|nr:C45 family peptidase [Natronomonas sp.]MDR9431048.1 C45 family peptidase [Natronomonas sp.]